MLGVESSSSNGLFTLRSIVIMMKDQLVIMYAPGHLVSMYVLGACRHVYINPCRSALCVRCISGVTCLNGCNRQGALLCLSPINRVDGVECTARQAGHAPVVMCCTARLLTQHSVSTNDVWVVCRHSIQYQQTTTGAACCFLLERDICYSIVFVADVLEQWLSFVCLMV